MNLFIPELGTKIILESDWSFDLFTESRNEALYLAAGFNDDYKCRKYMLSAKERRESFSEMIDAAENCKWKIQSDSDYYTYTFSKEVSLPAGSILTIDRIYIRKGSEGYSSVSFNLDRKSVNPDYSKFCYNLKNTKGRCRFWAKLNDVNKIQFKGHENNTKQYI